MHGAACWVDRKTRNPERLVAKPGEHEAAIGCMREHRELAAENVFDELQITADRIQSEYQ